MHAHLDAFASLGIEARTVRDARSLAAVTHLVLPGGESSTIDHLLRRFDLRSSLLARARDGSLSLFGTCAGAVLLGRADAPGADPPVPLGLLDVTLRRNAYGRQLASSRRPLHLDADDGRELDGHFIRAPRITRVGAGVRVLARAADGEPVAVEAPGLLATTFHPELSGDAWFHRRFLELAVAQA